MFRSYDDLKEAVENNKGVLTVSMADIRDAHGAHRLGANIRAEITRRLTAAGLGHYPDILPNYQTETIRLFNLGSPAQQVIEAIAKPDVDTDEYIIKLIKQSTGNSASNGNRKKPQAKKPSEAKKEMAAA